MVRYSLLFLFISFSSGQLIDELEILYKDDRFLFSPDSLVNKNGFWYSGDGDSPYTGRLKILSRDQSSKKVAECTIVNGVKNGNFMQYYDQKDRTPGIMGLYIDDKKVGTWTWIESSSDRRNRSWETTDMQIITSIEYRDGIKHGSVVVYKTDLRSYDFVQNYSFPLDLKTLQGNYNNGLKTGDWYYYDNIFSDFDLNTEPKRMIEASVHWSRKESYSDNVIFDSECREPWLKWIDCGDFENKYKGKLSELIDPEQHQVKVKEKIEDEIFTIKDDAGVDVVIDLEEFLMHIEQFHQSGDNIHKQGGHYFTVNDNLRRLLNEKIASN